MFGVTGLNSNWAKRSSNWIWVGAVLSNMYSIEALIDILVEKGLVTKEEVFKRIEEVVRVEKDRIYTISRVE